MELGLGELAANLLQGQRAVLGLDLAGVAELGRGELAAGLLQRLALGDVANGAQDQHALAGLQRAQADLNRKLLPILALPAQYHARPHRPHPRLDEEPPPMPQMGLAEPFRHKKLHRLSKQLLAPIAEQIFRLGVDQHDLPAAVDNHHRIRSRLQQGAGRTSPHDRSGPAPPEGLG